MTEPEVKKPSLWDLAITFATIGLTGIGGTTGPMRHAVVVKRRWASETEVAELFGFGQALPGAVGVNVVVLLVARLSGVLGALVSLIALIVPSMILAIVLSGLATTAAAASPRFAAAEVGVTAAIAGVFVSNGLRVMRHLWDEDPDVAAAWRCARIAIGALGVLLVVTLHVVVPLAMMVFVALSVLVERRLHVARGA